MFSSANALQTSLDTRNSTSPVRSLDFSSQSVLPVSQSVNQSGNLVPVQSWADKVRGTTANVNSTSAPSKTIDLKGQECHNPIPGLRRLSGNLEDCVVQDVNDDGDDEGWETVHRGRKMHGNHSKKANKTSEKLSNGKRETKSNDLRTQRVIVNGTCSNGDIGNHIDDKEVCTETHSNPGEASEKLLEIDDDKEMPALFLDGEDEQDTLSDIEHDKALSAAMEEEESLSRQIEEWHNQTIASVIEHEESLTKEIAEEEELVTAINGESQTSDIEQEEDIVNINDVENPLNGGVTTNGDSVSCYGDYSRGAISKKFNPCSSVENTGTMFCKTLLVDPKIAQRTVTVCLGILKNTIKLCPRLVQCTYSHRGSQFGTGLEGWKWYDGVPNQKSTINL